MFYYERRLRKKGYNLVIGVDEAGRGPLAGPVVAAAVILKGERFKNRVDDSKKLSPLGREKAFAEIITNCIFGLGIVDERVIDRLNILRATRLAMEEAVRSLLNKLRYRAKRIHIIVDGNIRLNFDYPYTSIIKGDGKSITIACASILAKVLRDRIMDSYDRVYPQYGFHRHKGYPTKQHRQALKEFGPSLIHRESFHYA